MTNLVLAYQKEVFPLIELKRHGLLVVALFVMLKIVFWNEQLVIVAKLCLLTVWMLFIPGYLLFYNTKMEYLEKIIAGSLVSAAIIGLSSYYVGLLGLHIDYHIFVLPALLILFGAWRSGFFHKLDENSE